MNRNQSGTEKAILQKVFICRHNHLCKKSYGIYPKKAARVSEFSKVARYKIKYRNKMFSSSDNWKLKFTKQYYSIKKSIVSMDKCDKRYYLYRNK